MADNVLYNETGTTVLATRDSGSVHHQKVLLEVMPDGSTPIGLPYSNSAGLSTSITNASIPVTDNNGSLTVDNAGTFAVQAGQVGVWTASVTVTSIPAVAQTGTWNFNSILNGVTVSGDVAHDGVDVGNPVKVGAHAISSSWPTAVNFDDRVNLAADLFGRALVTAAPPEQYVFKNNEWTSQQTGVALWTPAAGKRIALTNLTIATGGTVAGIVTVWFGSGTAFTVSTSDAVFRGEFAPSSTSRPGAVVNFNPPAMGVASEALRVTSSAAINPLYVQARGWEM